EPVAPLDPSAGEAVYEVDWATADEIEMEAPVERPAPPKEEYLEAAKARGLIRDQRVPDPPRFTFFSGVFTYPWRGVNLARWTAMSFGLAIAGAMVTTALYWLGFLGNQPNMLLGVMVSSFTIILSLAVLSFAAASCRAAIQDTADGHDEPQDASLPEWDTWVFSLLGWICLWAASAAIGYPLSLAIGPAAFLITGALLFPVLLLSALECDSWLLPYSPPVLRTLGYYFHGWLMFQLLTLSLLAGCSVAFYFGFQHSPYSTVVLFAPVLAAIMLIYSRLLGRLAWRASGAPAAIVETRQGAKDSPRRSETSQVSRKKKRKRIEFEFPDESRPNEGPQPPPVPRLNFHLRR
ncbi:MAG TPA: hypothetical protein VFW87_02385, partial [Pirellulales bacterium]|nr:hypothetical protein [Pirellulales bacterium]